LNLDHHPGRARMAGGRHATDMIQPTLRLPHIRSSAVTRRAEEWWPNLVIRSQSSRSASYHCLLAPARVSSSRRGFHRHVVAP
jgi:hypothetical protein